MDYQLTHMHTIGTGRDYYIDDYMLLNLLDQLNSQDLDVYTSLVYVFLASGNGTSVPEIRISNRERLFILKLGQRKQGITQIEIFFQRKILTFDIISLKFANPSKHFMSNQTI